MNAGRAAGLDVGSELVSLAQPEVRLRVVQADMSDALAERVSGPDEGARPGALFTLARWRPPLDQELRVAIGDELDPALRAALGRRIAESSFAVRVVPEAQAAYRLGRSAEIGGASLYWERIDDRDDLHPTLPERTDGVRGEPDAASAQLLDLAERLARIQAWLRLETPSQADGFPYHLVLRSQRTNAVIPGGNVFDGDRYEIVLRRDGGAAGRGVEPRYVYVFAIDSRGDQVLLFPTSAAGQGENLFPRQPDQLLPDLFPIGAPSFEVAPPFGTETLVLLTTREPLAHPWVLQGRAVRTRSLGTELDRLLEDAARRVGASSGPWPGSWSLRRLTIRTAAH
jgi:hypothetical protein